MGTETAQGAGERGMQAQSASAAESVASVEARIPTRPCSRGSPCSPDWPLNKLGAFPPMKALPQTDGRRQAALKREQRATALPARPEPGTLTKERVCCLNVNTSSVRAMRTPRVKRDPVCGDEAGRLSQVSVRRQNRGVSTRVCRCRSQLRGDFPI